MPVRICLYNGKDLSLLSRPPACLAGIHMPPNGLHVVRKRAQPDFSPDWTAIKSDALLHSGKIQTKPKISEGQNSREQEDRVSQHSVARPAVDRQRQIAFRCLKSVLAS